MLIVITDIGTLVSTFPSAVSMLCHRKELILSSNIICTVSGFLFNVTARMSVFLIAMLAIERAVTLLLPFRRKLFKSYICSVFIYFILNIILATLPLHFSSHGYYYLEVVAQCSWGVGDLSFVKGGSLLWQIITHGTIILPWLVPGFIVVVSCSISIIVLLQSERKRRRLFDSKFARRTNAATIRTKYISKTIVIMALVYIVFNVPCWLFYLYLFFNKMNPVAWLHANTAIYIHIFVSRLSVSLNAACNPIVYFCRFGGLKSLRSRKSSFSDSVNFTNNQNAMRMMSITHTRTGHTTQKSICSNDLLQNSSLESMKIHGQFSRRKIFKRTVGLNRSI